MTEIDFLSDLLPAHLQEKRRKREAREREREANTLKRVIRPWTKVHSQWVFVSMTLLTQKRTCTNCGFNTVSAMSAPLHLYHRTCTYKHPFDGKVEKILEVQKTHKARTDVPIPENAAIIISELPPIEAGWCPACVLHEGKAAFLKDAKTLPLPPTDPENPHTMFGNTDGLNPVQITDTPLIELIPTEEYNRFLKDFEEVTKDDITSKNIEPLDEAPLIVEEEPLFSLNDDGEILEDE